MSLWLVGALLLTSPTQALPPLPEGKWTSSWDQGECTIETHSGGERAATFAVRAVPGSRLYSFWLIDPTWTEATLRQPDRVAISLPPATDAVVRPTLVGTVGTRKTFITTLDATWIDRLASAQGVRAERDGQRLFDFPLRNADKAVVALRTCASDMLRKWGIDATAFLAERAGPQSRQPLNMYLNDADYPMAAVRARASGTVVVALTVGANGGVKKCRTVESSGHPVLDRRTCEVLTARPKFVPATDRNGAAMESIVTTRIRWALPR